MKNKAKKIIRNILIGEVASLYSTNTQAKERHPDGKIPDFYVLRRIPLSEITISKVTVKQNPSYPEK